MNKPEFTFCDLVRVAGYWPRVFQVDGYREEHWHYIDESYTVVVYELYDVGNNDWIEAEASDLTLVADAGQADEYLAANPAPVEPSTSFINYAEILGMEAVDVAKQDRKPTARELSAIEADRRKKERKERAAQIDNLLDQRNWYAGMLAKSNDESYGDRVVAIDCELKKLTEVE
jgi:hypothetical protein